MKRENNIQPIFWFRALVFSVLLISYNCAFAQEPYLQHFTSSDGLPSNNCFYTLQDSRGFIWVATDAGVSRFDGKVFENFSVDDGLPDNQILQLNEDREGRIWFLALNGQLSYFYNGKIYNERNKPLLRLLKFNAVIVSFFQDSKGRIWLGTNKNVLVMWDGHNIIKYISANHSKQFINTFIHEDKLGQIWAFSNHCIRILKDSVFESVPYKSLPLSYKTALNLPDKTMAYIDREGLKIKTGDQEDLSIKIDQRVSSKDLGYFFVSPSKDLWLSNNSGIYHLDSMGNKEQFLRGIASSQVIRDTQHNLWFTTNNGLYMLPEKSQRMYMITQSNGLSSNLVKSVTMDSRNRLWLGLDEASLNIVDKNDTPHHILKLDIPVKRRFNTIKQLNFDSAFNAVYFASDYGLGRVNDIFGSQRLDYLKESNDYMFVIKSFSLDDKQNLALALSSGVVILPDRINQFEFNSLYFKKVTDFFDNRSYSAFYDKFQNLWFSNINGLSEFADGKLYKYYEKSPLLTRRINDIAQLTDGTMILATDGYGIIYIKNRKVIKVITQRDGLASNICKKLFVKGNQVWTITNNGINKITLKGKELSVESFEFTSSLLSEGVNGLYIDHAHAYFATNKGLVYFSTSNAKKVTKAPNVYITSVVNNKVKLDLQQKQHILGPYDNNITFYYSAVDFQNKNVSYRYRLKPEAAWTETKARRLEFSSLEPGEYIFELSAKSNNSSWSSPATTNFTIERHFWQTLWFFLALLVISGLTLYTLAVRVTKRQKNKEQEKLLLRNKILMLEQRALQAMMNPHFVFNVMNSIQHYINTKDTTSANKILTGFARLIRKNLEICTKSYIPLEEELEYLQLYLSLEKKRFGEKFKYSITVDAQIDKEDTFIPSMILQPYIENAIWHGIMPKEEGGEIDINITLQKENYLSIEIRDNGIGIENSLRDKAEKHLSKGMDLTRERINLLNEVESRTIFMDIKQNGSSGTYVSILIPLN